MLEKGSITIAHLRGVPLRVHWTTPLGAILFTGFSINPLVWIGYFLVVLVHELGHATAVWSYGHEVVGIEVNGLGGRCEWAGHPTAKEDAVIAAGGVAAQALLFVATLILLALTGPLPWFLEGIVHVFVTVNVWILLVNLLPIPPLDGSRAWTLIPILAAERGWWKKTSQGAPGERPTSRWSRSAEWLQSLADENARRDAERRRKAAAAVEKELQDLDASDGKAAAPIPSEIRKVLDRILGKIRSAPPP
ncbi:MAG: M50 family metallopeptidase, partial [Byssovorax sp.]